MTVHLKENIKSFIKNTQKEFEIGEIVEAIGTSLPTPVPDCETRILNQLKIDRNLFHDDETSLFIPRSLYFDKARFLLVPTNEEIGAGILVPGHRFLPFCNPEIFPPECTLCPEDGIIVEKIKTRMNLDDVTIYLSLLGHDVIPDYLIYDDEANTEIFLCDHPESEEVIITVFDMQDLYRRYGMKDGDAFIVTVGNWAKGEYRFTYISKEEREKEKWAVKQWIADLESGFLRAFTKLGLPALISEQLAYAFYLGGEELIRHPLLNIGNFLASNDVVELKYIGSKSFLWLKDEEIRTEDISTPHVMKGDFDSLNDILTDINAPISSVEIEAFMRNELFHRKTSCEDAVERCLQYLDLHFYDQFQEDMFYRFIDELWEDITKQYNYFKDQAAGIVREKALALQNNFMEWIETLQERGFSINILIPEDIVLVSHGFESLRIILETCNDPEAFDNDGDIDFDDELEKTEALIRHIMETVEKRFEPDLKLVKKESPESVLILKIILRDIKPEIWRRIRIPGNRTLSELHSAIQTAMGWENYHLHSFWAGGVEYGDPSDNETEDVADESTVAIDRILGKEGTSITYEYDFGDSWLHTVTVEEIIPADRLDEDDRRIIKCLDGERSCPPEDCGGPPGYEHLVEILKNPSHTHYEKMRKWAADFDPEEFDIETINRKFFG
ncbi:MAG: plasmid pRiA4b ORF-3 family protein [Spirochaetales bacterium]|nr:plasmid pRiA4b ORF-3 family protein [Spirochaetales bacterium]